MHGDVAPINHREVEVAKTFVYDVVFEVVGDNVDIVILLAGDKVDGEVFPSFEVVNKLFVSQDHRNYAWLRGGQAALVCAYILKCKSTIFFLIVGFFFNHLSPKSLAGAFEG